MHYPARVKATVLFLCALALLSVVYGIQNRGVVDLLRVRYEAIEYEQRFQNLKQVLPRRGVLGYVGDSANDLRVAGSRIKYYLAQYTLAPLVIANRPDFPLVVGNFQDADPDQPFLQRHGLGLLTDAGNGVRLFRGREGGPVRASRVPLATVAVGEDHDGKIDGNWPPPTHAAVPIPVPEFSIVKLLWVVLTVLIGFLFTFCLLPFRGAPASLNLTRIFASIGIGFGISSCLTFVALHAGGLNYGRLLAAESVLLAVLAALAFRQWKLRDNADQKAQPGAACTPTTRRIVLVCFLLTAALSVAVFAALTVRDPHGGHDAFAIWNLRAKFLFKGGEYWADAFSRHIGWSNLGYPLLIPANVARGWVFAGIDSVAIPIAIASLLTFGAVGLMISALSWFRGITQGLIAGLVLLSAPFFPILAAWQVADVPLAFFFLSSLVLLCLAKHFQSLQYRMVFLAGLCAGFSAWTKNEGLLFVAVTLLALFIAAAVYRHDTAHRKNIVCYVLGALPVLIIVWYFKTQVVPDFASTTHNPIGSGQTGSGILTRLTDWSRHFSVLTAYQGELRNLGRGPFSMPIILVLYLFVLGTTAKWRSNAGVPVALATLVLMFIGYYAVYIIAPSNLTFSSLDRVLMHLWPSALFVFFMIARTPEEAIRGFDLEPREAQRA